ncbi:MAG TPA: hypothetical protein VGX68_13560 [Thermoanaerobaculia bacterium]|nr:hypothetical protein [Thermoanaerobaculia bacterium]
MDRCKILAFASIFTVAILLSACKTAQPVSVATLEPERPEPVLPAGYQKLAPAPVDSSQQMLAQTATIFRGLLKEVRFTYDECAGPRTHYVFSDAATLAGTQVQSQVTVKVLGGPTPYGTWIRVSELPKLALNSEYVVFLRNTDWTFSPIVGNLAFRREAVAGREVLINPAGYAVTGWGPGGPLLSANPVSEAVGGQRRGYREAEASQQTPHASSFLTNPDPTIRPASGSPPAPAPAPAPARTEDSAIARAPSLAEIRKSELFERPAVSAAALHNIPVFSAESLVAAVRAAAESARVDIGGRLTLNPYWRCWSSTPTAKPGLNVRSTVRRRP